MSLLVVVGMKSNIDTSREAKDISVDIPMDRLLETLGEDRVRKMQHRNRIGIRLKSRRKRAIKLNEDWGRGRRRRMDRDRSVDAGTALVGGGGSGRRPSVLSGDGRSGGPSTGHTGAAVHGSGGRDLLDRRRRRREAAVVGGVVGSSFDGRSGLLGDGRRRGMVVRMGGDRGGAGAGLYVTAEGDFEAGVGTVGGEVLGVDGDGAVGGDVE